MRIHRLLSTIMALTGLAWATAAAAASSIFLLDTDELTYATVFEVDQSTGRLTTLGSLPLPTDVTLGLAASDDRLYAVTQSGEVLQITPRPFRVVSIGNIGANAIVGLAFSDGLLYATDEATDQLYVIQLTPVSLTIVGEVRLGSTGGPVLDIDGGDLALDAAGSWYLWTNGTEDAYLLDVTNAVAVQLDPATAGLGAKSGLTFDHQGDGGLVASSWRLDALLTLDPATGATVASVNFWLAWPAAYDAHYGDLASARSASPPRATPTSTPTATSTPPPATPTPSFTGVPLTNRLTASTAVARGRKLYQTYCAYCHEAGSAGFVRQTAPRESIHAIRKAIAEVPQMRFFRGFFTRRELRDLVRCLRSVSRGLGEP